MRSGTPVAAVAGIVALASAGAVACTSQPGTGRVLAGSAGAARAVQAAYTATSDTRTATYRLEATVQAKSAAGSSQSATITGSGQVDFAPTAFTVSLNAPSGGTITILQVNGTEYLQVPAAARNQIPGHKPWVSVNLNKISPPNPAPPFTHPPSATHTNPTP